MTKYKKVYIVTIEDCEITSIEGIYDDYDKAFDNWNHLRKEMIKREKKMLIDAKQQYNKKSYFIKTHKKSIKALKCDNPKEIDNFPGFTPLIKEKKYNKPIKECWLC